jgi:hypothetical protein
VCYGVLHRRLEGELISFSSCLNTYFCVSTT